MSVWISNKNGIDKAPGHSTTALLLESQGDDAQLVKDEKRNAQNKVLSALLLSIQVYAPFTRVR